MALSTCSTKTVSTASKKPSFFSNVRPTGRSYVHGSRIVTNAAAETPTGAALGRRDLIATVTLCAPLLMQQAAQADSGMLSYGIDQRDLCGAALYRDHP
jgi:hypothetical protein